MIIPTKTPMAERPDAVAPERGYSLIELLISVALMTMILGGLFTVLTQTQGAHDVNQDRADLRQQARVAVEQLATELRMTGANIDNVPNSLPFAGPTGVQFIADIDAGSPAAPCGNAFETAANGGAERITYQLNAGQLVRSIDCWDGGGWNVEYTNQVVAQNIAGARIFRFYDNAGNELAAGGGNLSAAERDDVRVVRVFLQLDDGDDHMIADDLGDFDITTQVRLRNRSF